MWQDYKEFPQTSQRIASAHKAFESLSIHLLPNIPFVACHIIILLWHKIFMRRVIYLNELQNDGTLPKCYAFFFINILGLLSSFDHLMMNLGIINWDEFLFSYRKCRKDNIMGSQHTGSRWRRQQLHCKGGWLPRVSRRKG